MLINGGRVSLVVIKVTGRLQGRSRANSERAAKRSGTSDAGDAGVPSPVGDVWCFGGGAAESDHGGEAVELATGVGWIEEGGPLSLMA